MYATVPLPVVIAADACGLTTVSNSMLKALGARPETLVGSDCGVPSSVDGRGHCESPADGRRAVEPDGKIRERPARNKQINSFVCLRRCCCKAYNKYAPGELSYSYEIPRIFNLSSCV